MELSKEEKESIFLDLVINTFMINPQLYDKSEGTYIYTTDKIKILNKLSDYLQNEFKITKSVSDIVTAWQKLVAQFKKADQKQQSGSAATDTNFPFYEDLLFLKPTLKHKDTLSTMLPPIRCSITVPSTSTVTKFPFEKSSSLTNASASPVSGSQLYLPQALPYTAHVRSEQHPYWAMMSPYAFAPAVPPPYMPFASTFPAASLLPNHHMPTGRIDNTTSSVNLPHLAAALPYNYNFPSEKENRPVTKSVPTSLKRVPEYDSFAKKKIKVINDDECQLKQINNQIVSTLDNIKKKLESCQSKESCQSNILYPSNTALTSKVVSSSEHISSPINVHSQQFSELACTDYSNLLSNRLSKVPMEKQDELMEYLLEELIEFNEEYKKNI